MRRFIPLVCCFVFALPVMAQQGKSLQEVIKHWKTSKDFTLAVANAMPDGDYGFKPVPAEMSFGEVMAQVAEANGVYVARAAGAQNPIAKPEKFDKETVTKLLGDSFDFCIKTLEGMKDEDLDKMVGPAGRQSSARELVWAAFTHVAHHRGQAEVYLRLKGITPPAYKY